MPFPYSLSICFLMLPLLFFGCEDKNHSQEQAVFDVIILGGGTGGTAAGIQSARLGVRTLLVEPTPWLGGMLTAAGVSAIDGNHAMPAGIWGEFRQKLYEYYGGPEAVATGWVSFTLFEPSVGAAIFQEMTAAELDLEVWTESTWRSIARNGDNWTVELLQNGATRTVTARILIDGTDLGDVAAAAGAGYDLGMEARDDVGEAMAPREANDIIQDLTYVAILKDYGEGADRTIPEPQGYDPEEFYCSCATNCDGSYDLSCEQMLTYGLLPNGKYMINWPNKGNDHYADLVELSGPERQKIYRQARLHTLRFVYYIQHELGFPNLGLADDEFPTPDSLALIPYHREGRRFHGLARLNINHLINPFGQEQALYRTGIAVGDYPIDHHHDQNPDAPEIDFPPVPSFSIPAGALIPKDVEDILIADKPISVTNIVNGSSRLQPVVLQLGQAAGVMAALAVKMQLHPSALDVRTIQDTLLAAGGWLMPYYDVAPDHPHFRAIQRIGATGLLRGMGEPYQWANRTWFYPDTTLNAPEFLTTASEFFPGFPNDLKKDGALTLSESIEILQKLLPFRNTAGKTIETTGELTAYLEVNWNNTFGLSDFDPGRPVTKAEMAVLLDELIDPFSKKVDWTGDLLTQK